MKFFKSKWKKIQLPCFIVRIETVYLIIIFWHIGLSYVKRTKGLHKPNEQYTEIEILNTDGDEHDTEYRENFTHISIIWRFHNGESVTSIIETNKERTSNQRNLYFVNSVMWEYLQLCTVERTDIINIWRGMKFFYMCTVVAVVTDMFPTEKNVGASLYVNHYI